MAPILTPGRLLGKIAGSPAASGGVAWLAVKGQNRIMNRPVTFRPTSDICDDHHDDVLILDVALRSLGGRPRLAGRAVTIEVFEDNSLVKAAVSEPGTGQVLVVDGGGSLRRSLVGGNVAAEAAANGWEGFVVYGAVRDCDELAETDLAVFALGTVPRKTEKLGAGIRGQAVSFAGVTIHPGDQVFADRDGVVILPA
jgi:regulator of ribonuclease activity A